MAPEIIVGINVPFRETTAAKVQVILTKYGCNIKTRLGLHNADSKSCSPSGLILLQMVEIKDNLKTFLGELNAIEGVEAKSMMLGQ